MTIRELALRHAISFLGVHEQPPYSNRGPQIDEWNRRAGAPVGSFWCCSFVHSMFGLAGFDLPGGASVEAFRSQARREGWQVARPRRGDAACYDFHEGSRYGAFGDHIGLVERVLALRWRSGVFVGLIRTVEGNTSAQADLHGSQSNGGGVYRRWRWITGSVGAEFFRVPGLVPKPRSR